jgi:arylsulfatase A-like enzyme
LLDTDIGRILRKLTELQIDKNTFVFFTSDNGPHQEGGADPEFFDSNGPLKGMKRELYEGGIRVPTIAWWPGTIKAGTETGHISAFWDFLPTACEIAEIPITFRTDGISYLPAMTGGSQRQHEFLYWEFMEKGGRQAIRQDNWKAVRYDMSDDPDAHIELYDLSNDLGEEHNLADEHPAAVEAIKSLMDAAHTPSEVFQFDYEKNQ